MLIIVGKKVTLKSI